MRIRSAIEWPLNLGLVSRASQQELILEFFTEIGITDLPREQFEKAFLA